MIAQLSAKALLLDLDGTVSAKGQLIPGAAEAIATLRRAGYRLQFLTNIDSKTPEELSEQVERMGLPIPAQEIVTCLDAGCAYVAARPGRCYCLLPSRLATRFEAFGSAEEPVRYVILGDQRELAGYEPLNMALRHVMAGAEIVALQKGRFYLTAAGCNLDTGAFAAALEFASGKRATVVGKPAQAFFQAALQKAEADASEAIVVGDDITTDIAGASAAGIRSILVRTGKFTFQPVDSNMPQPTLTIKSIADLPAVVRVL